MARSTTDPEAQINSVQLPGEAPAPVEALPGTVTPRVADRLEAYRARERKTTQLARTLGRVFTNDELAQLFDTMPDGKGEPVQVLADALGKAWGDTRPGTTTE